MALAAIGGVASSPALVAFFAAPGARTRAPASTRTSRALHRGRVWEWMRLSRPQRRRHGPDRRHVQRRRAHRRDDARRHRRRLPHPPLLDHVHGEGPGLPPLLRLPEPVHLLDARARPGRQPAGPLRRLGGRRASAATCSSASGSTRTTNAAAGKKAFIANRIGDFGLLVAMFLLALLHAARSTGPASRAAATTLLAARCRSGRSASTFPARRLLAAKVPRCSWPASGSTRRATSPARPWSGLALFLGCAGKSAQIPLYVWLPGRDGRPNAGQRAHPRGHDGHRRRLPRLPHVASCSCCAPRR